MAIFKVWGYYFTYFWSPGSIEFIEELQKSWFW